jgi:hypothetical protein
MWARSSDTGWGRPGVYSAQYDLSVGAPVNTQETLSRLKAVRLSPNGWMARCPAHEDRNPSLSIREGDEKILLHCFAGCTIEAICAATRLKVSDLFAEPRAYQKPGPPIVRAAERKIKDIGLRLRLTPTERATLEPIVILTKIENLDAAICRGLALAVEGELCQIALTEQKEWK